MSSDPTPTTDPAKKAGDLASDLETIVSDVAQAAETITKANAWTALLGICTALPGLVKLLLDFIAWANKVSGGNPGTLIANFGAQVRALMASKTKEDRQNAAQQIANLFGHLP